MSQHPPLTGNIPPQQKAQQKTVVPLAAKEKEITLLDLVDRILNKGVILYGDVTLSVADIDLVFLSLKVLLTSVETAEKMKRAAVQLGAGGGVEAKIEAPVESKF